MTLQLKYNNNTPKLRNVAIVIIRYSKVFYMYFNARILYVSDTQFCTEQSEYLSGAELIFHELQISINSSFSFFFFLAQDDDIQLKIILSS